MEYVKNEKKEPLPPEALDDTRMGLRFLYGMNMNFEKAYEIIMWRVKEEMPKDPKEFSDFLKTGAVYIPSRCDKAGKQPVIVVDVKRFIDEGVEDMDIDTLELNLKFIFNWV